MAKFLNLEATSSNIPSTMMERFRQKVTDFRNKITSNFVIFKEPQRGIEFEFIFGGEYDADVWEKQFSELRPDNIEKLEIIIGRAYERTPEERAKLVNHLTSSKIGFEITKDARDKYQSQMMYEQFIININSMSQTNLENMHHALQNLQNK